MANELFTRTETQFGGAMHAQYGIITPKNGLSGVLMQNVQLSYQQQVTRLYELGIVGQKSRVFYVSGRASGSMSVAHVIGPGLAIKQFYDTFGDVCKAGNNTCEINLTPNLCSGSAKAVYTCKYCVLVAIGVAVAAQDFVVNENSQLMFSGLEFSNTGGAGAVGAVVGGAAANSGGFGG